VPVLPIVAWSLVVVAVAWSVAGLVAFARFARREATLLGEAPPEPPIAPRVRLGELLPADAAPSVSVHRSPAADVASA
jgi:hypothetical protein